MSSTSTKFSVGINSDSTITISYSNDLKFFITGLLYNISFTGRYDFEFFPTLLERSLRYFIFNDDAIEN